MPEKYTYFLVDFFCIIFPLLFSFHAKIKFYKNWRYFLLPCLAAASFFIVWDVLFTKLGVWSFSKFMVVGIFFFGLPLEEYLFFFCIPYACLFTYHCVGLISDFSRHQKLTKLFSLSLIVVLLCVAVVHLPQLYTSVTFILLSLFLMLLVFSGATFLPLFYVSFLIILIPFFISNGILTGSFIREPVVVYNNSYNLGVRMFTIPVEDTFYGMLLLLMNVAGYEYLRNRGPR